MTSAEDQNGQQPQDWLERYRPLMIWSAIIAAIIIIGRLTPFQPIQRGFGIFGWVTETAVDISRELFEDYGELTIFLAPLLENTIFLGALIPATLIVVLAGVATENGLMDLHVAIPLGIVGAIIGDTISYWIGRFGWQKLGPEARLVKWSERIRQPLMDHSVWLILSYHFAGYSRLVGPASAGFLRMPFFRWAPLDYLGVTLWVVSFILAGYALGAAGLNLDDPSERDIQIFEIFLFALLMFGIFLIFRRAGQRRKEEETRQTAEPASSVDGSRTTFIPALDPADPPSEEEQERAG